MFEQMIYHARLTWRLLFDPRVPKTTKLIPLGAVLYVLSPFDIIPDIFLTLGQLDDIGLVLLSMRVFIQTIPSEIVEEHRAILDGRRENMVEGTATKVKRKRRTSKTQEPG